MKRSTQVLIGALAAVVVLMIPAMVWLFTVVTSPVKGAGDATIKKNSAENWTAAQARFEDLYQDVLATDKKITVAAEALAADPDDRTLQTNYTGTVNYCLSIVADYNADARKYLAEEFRAADLPAEIPNTSSTDCKEDR